MKMLEVPRVRSRRVSTLRNALLRPRVFEVQAFCLAISASILLLNAPRAYGEAGNDCSWTAPASQSPGVWTLSGCSLALDKSQTTTAGLSVLAGREPLDWLPPALHPPTGVAGGNASRALLHNLTIALSTCATLWDLIAMECTVRASARWPSPGLQVRL